MRESEFLMKVGRDRVDVLRLFLDALHRLGAEYCVIGGLAVNAYAEPVVSLDLDVVVIAAKADLLCSSLSQHFRIERFPHNNDLKSSGSDLRIQIQTDARYQEFLGRAEGHEVLGYEMAVACVEDVLQGKLWAYEAAQRRMSKRQKDLADILRLVEQRSSLIDRLPASIRALVE